MFDHSGGANVPRQWVIAVLVSLVLLVPLQTVGAEPACGDLCRHDPQGASYCFNRVVVFGPLSVNTGCYTFYMVGPPGGTFLGFGPNGASLIPPGQVVRLNTPAGAKVKGRLFYLVPITAAGVRIPVDTIQATAVKVNVSGTRVLFVLPQGNVRVVEGRFPEH